MKSVIDLIKTPQGYSIIQDGHQINKIGSRPTKQKQYTAPKKFIQQNFTIYPYLYCQEPEYTQKYIVLPARSSWFNLNQIHEIERKALPEWFRTKKVIFGAAKPDKFEKNEELYRKYRNYIIDLARNQYVSPTAARKGLAGDVCAILRIHSFLQKNGLINYVFPKKAASIQPVDSAGRHPDKNKTKSLVRRKDCVDKDKSIFDKHFDKDHYELLKKITKKYRPPCHLCEGVCGVLWYQYQEQLILKSFQAAEEQKDGIQMEQEVQQRKISQQGGKKIKTKIIKSDKSFTYMLRLCSSCFSSGNLPVVLSYDDFERKSILDAVKYSYEQPKDKKKIAEQNKLIQQIEKNKFNLKKTAESLKISQEELFQQLLCLPLIKIEKLARIDPQYQEDEGLGHNGLANGAKLQEKTAKRQQSMVKMQENSDQALLKQFQKDLQDLNQQQIKLYQQLIQLWLLKISTKITKLSQWQKSTKWFSSRLINDQKNNLASALKQKM